MNKIVREHYPVDLLPEELRRGLQAGRRVTVTVSEEEPTVEELKALVMDILGNPEPITLKELRTRIRPQGLWPGEAARRIRSLRDEWDD